ncbi:MAG TPA: SpoIIE family protein phosphatase, partial [Steroidobacteraceae bacterium]|nr:SpoIIE family protein phosphatase [Steroidobacteraceae bacterium]
MENLVEAPALPARKEPRRLRIPAVFQTVRGRMVFWVLAVTVPIYAAALFMSYEASARRLEAAAKRDSDELAARLAAGIDSVIRSIEGGVRTVAGQLEEVDPPREQYLARIRGILAAWPDVYGSTIAVEVGAEPGTQPFAPYLFRQGSGTAYSDLALESYNYRQLPWYRRAADSGRPVWSEPYFDAGGGEIWMVTYSVPFFRRLADGERPLVGVVTADLDLKWVEQAAAQVTLGPNSVGWLASPPGERSFVTPIGDTPQRIRRQETYLDVDKVREVGERMLANGLTFELMPPTVAPQPAYLAVHDIDTLGWRLMLAVPRSEVLAQARELLNRQLLLGAAGFVLLITAISLVAAGISRPLHALAESVGRADDLDFRLPEGARRDEIGVLTEALRRMRDALQRHIQLRAESLAAQTSLERELQIARSIQQSMLPRHDSVTLPVSARIGATLLPAKQVGGDLYDYFAVGEDALFFVIGDVSDKGVPAALFMARLSALIRVMGAKGELPNKLLSQINARLAEGNDACMFVTVGCGLLHFKTGRMRYASAGHEPPLLRAVDGTVHPLVTHNGPAIGIEGDVEYELLESFIAPGDALVLYTDGVTEASTEDGTLFGNDRLGILLGQGSDGDPDVIVKQIVDAVATHASGFHVTDDLTVLAISIHPRGVKSWTEGDSTHWLIEPEISAAGIQQAQRWLHAILAARGVVTPSRIGDAELIAEELLTNVARAVQVRAREAYYSLECALRPREIVLTVRDNGPPFDPLARSSPKLDVDIAERGIGGLGIAIVRELADSC